MAKKSSFALKQLIPEVVLLATSPSLDNCFNIRDCGLKFGF